jgi:hypothetical protein
MNPIRAACRLLTLFGIVVMHTGAHSLIHKPSAISRRWGRRFCIRRGLAYGLWTLIALQPLAAHAVGTQMFATVAASTGEKPQSKIWYHDGSYWAILQGSSGVAFYEKVASNWQLKTFANAVLTSSGCADVKWNGTDLFVLNYVLGGTNRLYKYSYASAIRAWVLASGFPVTMPNPSGSETMVLDQDSTGRLWATAEGGGSIQVWYSTSADQRSWIGSPVVLQTGVNDDDISSVIAFGNNKIGVFWSDQNRWNFGFRIHQDADAPGTWGATEVVVSGTGISDDHVNLARDASGQVYAVTKDVNNRMRLHRRSTGGAWTTQTDVIAGTGTRGIVQISDADAKIYVLFTDWDASPFTIQYRSASLSTLSFGATTTFISASTDLNNVTGTKQPLPAGNLIAVAENMTHCWFNSIGTLGGGGPVAPDPPTNLQAGLVLVPARVDLTWSQPASGAPSGYNVYVQANGGPFTKLNSALVTTRSYSDNAPAASPLCYRVTAVAAALEGAPSASACVDNTPLPAPNVPQSLSVTLTDAPDVLAALQLDFDAGSGQTVFDISGNANHGRLGSGTGSDSSDPTWIGGVDGNALRFDGSNDYIEIADAPSLDMPSSFTIEAWIQQADGAGTGTLVNKGESGERTYRIRVTSSRDIEFRWDTNSGSARGGDRERRHSRCRLASRRLRLRSAGRTESNLRRRRVAGDGERHRHAGQQCPGAARRHALEQRELFELPEGGDRRPAHRAAGRL